MIVVSPMCARKRGIFNPRIEPDVTVVLGPNDHGKTNFLNALVHLNEDSSFDIEKDLNWDRDAEAETLPRVAGTFELTEEEREFLLSRENELRGTAKQRIGVLNAMQRRQEALKANAAEAGEDTAAEKESDDPAAEAPDATANDAEQGEDEEERAAEVESDDDDDDDDQPGSLAVPAVLEPLTLEDVPRSFVASREGLGGDLMLGDLEKFTGAVRNDFAKRFMPRFELISPSAKLSDGVTAAELVSNDFMRGIFYYAGLDPDEAGWIFKQDDRSQMALKNAEALLNATLRLSWNQGKTLNFRLSHHSKTDRIELQIQDPAVKSRYVRASCRSSGFTHYFALKTQLHARQKDHPASTHVFMFDEPGVFLHPSGQHDLMQVLETLSIESQILYVTHSIFMLNKTFPTRHRLLQKGQAGTEINGKPYVGKWEAALSALGVSLTGSILFANHVLITEGDSDPIYLYAILQAAAASGEYDLDINALSIIGSQDVQYADVLIRLLSDTAPKPSIGVLVDGDKGGNERAASLKELVDDRQIPLHQLTKNLETEDCLPLIPEVYLPGLAIYAAKIVKGIDVEKLKLVLVEKYASKADEALFAWGLSVVREFTGDPKLKLSKVGIAREYAMLVATVGKVALPDLSRALVEAIKRTTKLRGRLLVSTDIIAES